jgi:hypothetical protein
VPRWLVIDRCGVGRVHQSRVRKGEFMKHIEVAQLNPLSEVVVSSILPIGK